MEPFTFQYRQRSYTLYLHPAGEYLSDRIRSRGTWYEDQMLEDIAAYYPQPPNLILDVGANLGNHTVYWASVLGARQVLAFEPHPLNRPLLEANVAQLPNVRVVPYALGADAGAIHLNVNPANMGKVGAVAATSSESLYPVEVRTLDAVLAEVAPETPVALIKVDVEGMELNVLRGAIATLTRWKPILLIEANTLRELGDVLDFLAPLGYVLTRRHNAYANAPTFEYRVSARKS
jgi:protein O-GlcNAc transferase